jgi:hypothetical protein
MPELSRSLKRLSVIASAIALALVAVDGVDSTLRGDAAAFYVGFVAIILGLAGALLAYLRALAGAETVASVGWQQGNGSGYANLRRRPPWWVMVGGLLVLGVLIRPPTIKSLIDWHGSYTGVVVRRGFEWPMLPPYERQWFVIIRNASGHEEKRYTNFYAENRVRAGDSVVKDPGFAGQLRAIPRSSPPVR